MLRLVPRLAIFLGFIVNSLVIANIPTPSPTYNPATVYFPVLQRVYNLTETQAAKKEVRNVFRSAVLKSLICCEHYDVVISDAGVGNGNGAKLDQVDQGIPSVIDDTPSDLEGRKTLAGNEDSSVSVLFNYTVSFLYTEFNSNNFSFTDGESAYKAISDDLVLTVVAGGFQTNFEAQAQQAECFDDEIPASTCSFLRYAKVMEKPLIGASIFPRVTVAPTQAPTAAPTLASPDPNAGVDLAIIIAICMCALLTCFCYFQYMHQGGCLEVLEGKKDCSELIPHFPCFEQGDELSEEELKAAELASKATKLSDLGDPELRFGHGQVERRRSTMKIRALQLDYTAAPPALRADKAQLMRRYTTKLGSLRGLQIDLKNSDNQEEEVNKMIGKSSVSNLSTINTASVAALWGRIDAEEREEEKPREEALSSVQTHKPFSSDNDNKVGLLSNLPVSNPLHSAKRAPVKSTVTPQKPQTIFSPLGADTGASGAAHIGRKVSVQTPHGTDALTQPADQATSLTASVSSTPTRGTTPVEITVSSTVRSNANSPEPADQATSLTASVSSTPTRGTTPVEITVSSTVRSNANSPDSQVEGDEEDFWKEMPGKEDTRDHAT